MSTVGIHGGTSSSGQTDTEARAYQTSTGSISGNGQSVTLSLNGAGSAAVKFNVPASFAGTVRFYTSQDNGTSYTQCQAVRPLSFDVVNSGTPAFDGSNSLWVFCLTGAETHVRVTSVSYTSGSVDLTFYGSPAPTSAILNAMASSGDNNKPSGHVVIAGALNTGSYAIAARSDDPSQTQMGLVVRNISASYPADDAADGLVTLVGGRDPDDNSVKRLELDNTTPDGTEYGLITRNIPSGTQTVAATNLDIRDLTAASDSVAIGDGSNLATIRNLAANDALNVAIVDGSGDQITSFGGGTQYTEGDVDASITGTAAMMEVAGNTLQPVQGTVADGLLVNLGTNNDVTITGTVAVTQSGAWDEVGINDSGNSITIDNATLSVVGGGVEASALRVTIASDSTGVLSIDDNGGSLTVDGTVTTKTALTASSPAAASVGVASAQAVASNGSRKGLILVNTSSNTISLGIGAAAVLNSGITLLSGASWTMNEYSFVTGAINAIASGASSNLSIQEFT